MGRSPGSHAGTPSSARGRRAVAAATVVVALLALAPGSWGRAHGQTSGPAATPPPAPTPIATAVPAAGGTLSAPSQQIAVQLPAGAAGQAVVVAIVPVVSPSAAPVQDQARLEAVLQNLGVPVPQTASGQAALVVQVFELGATSATTGAPVNTFAVPVTIFVDVAPEVRALAGGDLSNVSLQFFDTATGRWTPVPCTPTTIGLDCRVTHFSLWAVVVRGVLASGAAPGPAPAGSLPAPAPSGGGALAGTVGALRDGVATRAIPAALGALALALVVALAVADVPRLHRR